MAPTHLSRRAQVTVNGWAGILTIVILVAAALFCILAVLLIIKRKRARRVRQRKLAEEQESRPFVAQENNALPVAFNAQPTAYSAPESHAVENKHVDIPTGPSELQAGMAEEARMTPQQLDGYAAPATAGYDGRAVEMPAQPAR
jgi:preprotein translocase subunit SecG